MTTSLIDSLNDVNTPELAERLATSLGEQTPNVATGLSCGMASMLMGILSKRGDALAMNDVFGLLTDSANDGGVLDDPTKLVGSPADAPMATLGRRFLATIFGPRAAAVNERLVRQTGLRFSSVASLMQVAAPLVLGVLGKRVRDAQLTQATFTTLLNDEATSIQQAAPAGMSESVGMQQHASEIDRSTDPFDRDARAEAAQSYRRSAESGRSRSWLWPMAIAAGIAVVWALSRRHRAPEVAIIETNRIDTSRIGMSRMDTSRVGTSRVDTGRISAAAGDVAAPLVTSGMKRVRLLDGKMIEVPEASSEARIVGFLTDSTKATDDTTWFALDELQFDANSAHLRPQSSAQLGRFAQIMKAYPTAAVKIAGFTDNVGSAAKNRKLSRDRAESARDAIVRDGVDGSRIEAEGYGPDLPRADNSTEAGRAQNRRVALLFVRK